jgi:hypothetical protein
MKIPSKGRLTTRKEYQEGSRASDGTKSAIEPRSIFMHLLNLYAKLQIQLDSRGCLNHHREVSSSHPTAETRFPASSARGVLSQLFTCLQEKKRIINNDLIDLKFKIQLADSSMVLYMIMGKTNHNEFIVTSKLQFSKASGGENMH